MIRLCAILKYNTDIAAKIRKVRSLLVSNNQITFVIAFLKASHMYAPRTYFLIVVFTTTCMLLEPKYLDSGKLKTLFMLIENVALLRLKLDLRIFRCSGTLKY